MRQPPRPEHMLIGDIYDAALDPSLWSGLIARIAELTEAEKGNLLAYDRLNPDNFLFHSCGIPPEDLQYYRDGGIAALDQVFSGKCLAGYEGRALANHRHFGSIERFKAEAGSLYTDFFSKVGFVYQMGGLLEMTDFRWSVIGLHRGEQGKPFSDATLEVLSCLLPHIRRSLQIHRQMSSHQHINTPLYRTLDTLLTGVMLLDGAHRVRYANARAEQLLRQNNELHVTAGHALEARHDGTNAVIQRMLNDTTRASLRENNTSDIGGVVDLKPGSGRSRLLLTITPLSGLAGYEELATDSITTALFVSAPDDGLIVPRHLLKNAYGLTPRECDICQAFINHASLEAISTNCGLSLASIRTYLKAIYDKTGQHSQAELMRLLMGHTHDFRHLS